MQEKCKSITPNVLEVTSAWCTAFHMCHAVSTDIKDIKRPTEPRSQGTASHAADSVLRNDQPADTFDELSDPRLRALARRLARLSPWPVDPGRLARTKEELLKQLDRTSERKTI